MRTISSLILLFFFVTKPALASDEAKLVVTTFDGKNFDLKEKRGKIVVVNFWAYWCKECALEMIALEEMSKECRGTDFEIIGLSVDRKKSLKDVLIKAQKVSYPNALLVDASENNFPKIDSVPTTYVVDRDGVARVLNKIPTCSQLK
ncbi:MAG: TlpA family protein disulfide reductase [Proteobacteria bacterium]|nr:TlpA family protein disulfide reductase [Pseudomonadota bacterium]